MIQRRRICHAILLAGIMVGAGTATAWAQEAPPGAPVQEISIPDAPTVELPAAAAPPVPAPAPVAAPAIPPAPAAAVAPPPSVPAPVVLNTPVLSPNTVPQVTSASKHPNPSNTRGIIALPSIFFTPEEHEMLERAKAQYAGAAPEETEADLLDQLQGIKATSKKVVEEPVETTYPQFYLVSLMYHSPEDWAVWVRDLNSVRKIDPKTLPLDTTIKVLSVGQETVILEWAPRNWTYVTRSYKPATPGVSINNDIKRVRFVLRVNQTFESGEMAIKEGVIAPVRVQQLAPAPATPEKTENTLPGAAASDKNPVPAPVVLQTPAPGAQ